MQHGSVAFSIPEIRNVIPERFKPWLLILFLLIYQLSGGVYLSAVYEMSSSLALMQEDIMMAGYASLVGMALTFTFMYRLKFRFQLKTSLLVTAIGLIVCNIICANTSSVPVLVAVCFFSGFLRMWGTFACNTTIQLWITPTRDMSVWFCYIYLVVQVCMQFSGLVTGYISFLTSWEYMHLLVIGLLFALMLVVLMLFVRNKSFRTLPLFGIDWMGGILWGIAVLCTIFILNYGEYYDWYQSVYIWMGTVLGITSLGLNLWRASFIRHPFIALETWRFHHVRLTFLLYIVVDILISPSHLFEHLYANVVLRYDAINILTFSWIELAGVICGAVFTYYVFALRKWKYKTMTIIAFSCILGYLSIMYFIVDYNLPKEMLFFPIFVRGVGYVIVAIVFITSLSSIPFQNFFQSLTIQAFISACCGSLIGNAFLSRLFKFTVDKNMMLLTANIDNVNHQLKGISMDSLLGEIKLQAMMVSFKEIYGWLCILGIICLLVFLLKVSTLRPKSFHPKFSKIRHAVKAQLKLDEMSVES